MTKTTRFYPGEPPAAISESPCRLPLDMVMNLDRQNLAEREGGQACCEVCYQLSFQLLQHMSPGSLIPPVIASSSS
jgi:hypothetical protein